MVGSLQSLIKSMARVKAVINTFQTVECGNQAGEERIDLLIPIHSVVGQAFKRSTAVCNCKFFTNYKYNDS